MPFRSVCRGLLVLSLAAFAPALSSCSASSECEQCQSTECETDLTPPPNTLDVGEIPTNAPDGLGEGRCEEDEDCDDGTDCTVDTCSDDGRCLYEPRDCTAPSVDAIEVPCEDPGGGTYMCLTNQQAGPYLFRVQASDDVGVAGVRVTVEDAHNQSVPPIVEDEAMTLLEGEEAWWTYSFTAAEGPMKGYWRIVVVAYDGEGNETEADKMMRVRDPEPPVIEKLSYPCDLGEPLGRCLSNQQKGPYEVDVYIAENVGLSSVTISMCATPHGGEPICVDKVDMTPDPADESHYSYLFEAAQGPSREEYELTVHVVDWEGWYASADGEFRVQDDVPPEVLEVRDCASETGACEDQSGRFDVEARVKDDMGLWYAYIYWQDELGGWSGPTQMERLESTTYGLAGEEVLLGYEIVWPGFEGGPAELCYRLALGDNAAPFNTRAYPEDAEHRCFTVLDRVPPVITDVVEHPGTGDLFGPYVVPAKITDNHELEGATLYYRLAGAEAWSEAAMGDRGEDLYAGAIPGHPLGTAESPRLVEYYLLAEDSAGNQAVYPGGTPEAPETLSIELIDRDAPKLDLSIPERTFAWGPFPVVLTVTDDGAVKAADLYVQYEPEGDWLSAPMMRRADGTYMGVLQHVGSDNSVRYYVEVSDWGGHTASAGTRAEPLVHSGLTDLPNFDEISPNADGVRVGGGCKQREAEAGRQVATIPEPDDTFTLYVRGPETNCPGYPSEGIDVLAQMLPTGRTDPYKMDGYGIEMLYPAKLELTVRAVGKGIGGTPAPVVEQGHVFDLSYYPCEVESPDEDNPPCAGPVEKSTSALSYDYDGSALTYTLETNFHAAPKDIEQYVALLAGRSEFRRQVPITMAVRDVRVLYPSNFHDIEVFVTMKARYKRYAVNYGHLLQFDTDFNAVMAGAMAVGKIKKLFKEPGLFNNPLSSATGLATMALNVAYLATPRWNMVEPDHVVSRTARFTIRQIGLMSSGGHACSWAYGRGSGAEFNHVVESTVELRPETEAGFGTGVVSDIELGQLSKQVLDDTDYLVLLMDAKVFTVGTSNNGRIQLDILGRPHEIYVPPSDPFAARLEGNWLKSFPVIAMFPFSYARKYLEDDGAGSYRLGGVRVLRNDVAAVLSAKTQLIGLKGFRGDSGALTEDVFALPSFALDVDTYTPGDCTSDEDLVRPSVTLAASANGSTSEVPANAPVIVDFSEAMSPDATLHATVLCDMDEVASDDDATRAGACPRLSPQWEGDDTLIVGRADGEEWAVGHELVLFVDASAEDLGGNPLVGNVFSQRFEVIAAVEPAELGSLSPQEGGTLPAGQPADAAIRLLWSTPMIKATVESQLSVEVPAGAAYELAWPSDEQLDVTLLTPLAEGDRVRVVLLPGARGQNGSISRDGLERSYEAVATMGRLYEHPDYDGRFVTVSDDVIDLDELDFDDAVSSFTFFGEVDPTDLNKTVLLWQHDCAPDQSCYELNGGDAGRIKLRIPLDVAWIEEQYPGWDDRVSALTFGWGHCGDATCQGGEDCESCEADCGACPFCGDEHCNGDETCETCGSDCGPCPVCGDGQCTGDESSFTCAEDCYCGNGTCEWQTERACNCAADCGPRCGDGCCSQGESACGCPSDCYPVCGDGCCTGGEAGYCCADCPWGSRCR